MVAQSEVWRAAVWRVPTATRDRFIAEAKRIDWDADPAAARAQLEQLLAAFDAAGQQVTSRFAAREYALMREEQIGGAQWQPVALQPTPANAARRVDNALQGSSTLDGAVNRLANQIGRNAKSAGYNTLAANMRRDPTGPRYKVLIGGDMAVCAAKNAPEWHCATVASNVERLKAGETPPNWFHPNCHCEVIPLWPNRRTEPATTLDPRLLDSYTMVRPDGDKVPWKPSDRPEIRDQIGHIMDRHGDTADSWSNWPKKEKFTGWSEDDVERACDLVLAAPTSIYEYSNTLEFERRVNGLPIRVRVQMPPTQPWEGTGYPIGPTGIRQGRPLP